jgi:hypothetical protein
MTTSYNGWPAGSRQTAHIVVRTVPGTKVALPVAADAAGLLIWAAEQWNDRVDKLNPNWCWGWADRLVRGSTVRVSNHASGTAIDLNAPKHPRGVPTAKTMTAKQIREVHQILAEANTVHHVLDWGGDYKVSQPDAMHLEIAAGATTRQVQAAANRLTKPPQKAAVKKAPAKKATPPTLKELLDMKLTDKVTIPGSYLQNPSKKAQEVTVEALLRRIAEWSYIAAYGNQKAKD